MDFILNRINRRLEVEDDTLNEFTIARERVEYLFIFILGYLWNKNFDNLVMDNKSEIVTKLSKLQIGDIVSIVRELDTEKEIFNKKTSKVINEYPSIRNEKVGHGYVHTDNIDEFIDKLDDIYNVMVKNIKVLATDWNIIYVKGVSDNIYKGERYNPIDGMPSLWSCSKEIFMFEKDRIYAYDSNEQQYIKLSPFIHLTDGGENKYIFRKLEEKLSGKSLFNQILSTGTYEMNFEELACIYTSDSDVRVISSNKTIMNKFDNNYDDYIEPGFSEIKNNVKKFILENKSIVSGTIWGHGGIGKTACIQKICNELFNASEHIFDYIVFLSAKDREYNTATGTIEEIEQNNEYSVKTFAEIITSIGRTINYEIKDSQNETQEIIDYLISYKGRILIIIDDLETIDKKEIEKLEKLITQLDAHVHRVIFTTRSKIIIGQELVINELNETIMMDFLEKVISNLYPTHLKLFRKLRDNSDIINIIHNATDGRPIFLFQFGHLFAQDGLEGDRWKTISSSAEAKEFLYGRVYSYLTPKAQTLFCIIPMLVDKEHLIFTIDVLKFVAKKYFDTENEFDESLIELMKLKITEQYQINSFRVYSHEIVNIMADEYDKRDQKFKDRLKQELKKIGGAQAVTKSINQARLDEANKLRQTGNRFEVEDTYRNILNTPDIPIEIKKKALTNLVSYFQISLLSNQFAIKVFRDYYKFFTNDPDICRLYAQTLWAEGEKENASEILEDYLKKNRCMNTELQYLNVAYKAENLISRHSDINEEILQHSFDKISYSSEYGSILKDMKSLINEYGKKIIAQKDILNDNKAKPIVKHNLEVALVQVIKIYLILAKSSKEYEEGGLNLTQFALDNLNKQYYNGLKKIYEEFDKINSNIMKFRVCKREHKIGDIVEGVIEHVENYGAFVRLDEATSGLLHISKFNHFSPCIYSEIEVGDIMHLKICRLASDNKIEFSLLQ
ncbi:NB-ARC domain-containing protein [Anaerosporobacter faecicola]|uniref:NB-ARC domain-containing protein n=1 Tax=Anaerosporobacter faecicola TaxID=2718714 RepID=UPI00143CAAED|nr:NB-ARC domain-containing protein [Anaerosporobacter faecicola]